MGVWQLCLLHCLPTREKVILSSILVVCGEASFLIAVLILGRDAISRYRKLVIFITGFLGEKSQ
jgi:hypothetical protein